MTARFSRCLGALAPQFLHACSDRRKIVSSAGAGALAAQLLHARSDRRKIVSGAGAGHVSSVFGARQYLRRPSCGARAQYVDLRRARRLVPAINGSIPEAPGGGHSSQDGTVLDAAAGDTADDDAPTLAGAVDVVTAGDVEVEGVVVIAGKLTAPRS
jgi:hypothetical protein